MEDRLYTEREVAEMLNLSLATLKKLRDEGKITFLKLSERVIRYTKKDIDKYLAKCRVNDK